MSDEGSDEDETGEPGDDEVARRTAASDDGMVYAAGREGDDSWIGKAIAALLVIIGILLLLIGESTTLIFGAVLIVAGVVAWLLTAKRK